MKRARVVPTVRVVHVCPPIRVSTDSSNFRAVVQELTGNRLCTASSCPRPHDRSKLPEASSPASSYSAALHHCTAGGGASSDINCSCHQYAFLPTIATTIADVGKHEECGEVIQEVEEYAEGEEEAYLSASLNPCLTPQSISTSFSLQDQAPNRTQLYASPLSNQNHVSCNYTSLIEGKLEEQEEEQEEEEREGEASCNTYNTRSASEDSSHTNSVPHIGSSEVDSVLLQRRTTAKLIREEEDGHDQGFLIAGGSPQKRMRLTSGPNQKVNDHRSDISTLSGTMKGSPSFSSDSSIVSAWDQYYGAAEASAMISAIEDGYAHDEYGVDRVRASSSLGSCNMIIDMQTLFDQCETHVTGELLHPSAATVPFYSDFQCITDLINLSDLNYHSFDSSFLLS